MSEARTVRLLLVEDDREDAELVEELLAEVELWRTETTWAPTYERGLELLREGRYHLCLLDFHLGAKTGVDFLREPEVVASGVPVILMTGKGTPAVDRDAWKAGAADYLPKDDLTAVALERAIRYGMERKRRRRAEARLDALVGASRELVTVVDEEGAILYVSPSLEGVLGFDPAEKRGSSSLAEVHPDDRERVREALVRAVQHPGETQELQYRVRRADGSWRVLDTVAENRLDDPDIAGVVVSSWDVTERARYEEQIRFQADLLNAVGQAVMATDMDGKVIYWNRAAERIYGWKEEEVLGRDVVEVTPSDTTRGQAREIMSAMRRGEPWTGGFELTRKDGTTFPGLVTNTPIFDEEGCQVGIVGVSQDITTLKETEAELEERVKEMSTLYRATRQLHEHDTPMEERLQRFVEILPWGWLHPEVTEARLTLPDAAFATAGFRPSPWRLSTEVDRESSQPGRLEVVVTEERPEQDEGPFLAEERDLLDALGTTLAEALERNRLTRHLTQTIAGLEEAVLVIDSREHARKIQSANPAATRIFGYSEEEMVGRTTEFLHVSPEAFRRFAEEGNPVLSQGEAFHAEYPMKRKDGTTFHAEQTVSLLDPAKGLEGGAVSVIRDVSEAREAEAKLRASEERFRQIAERIESVFWIASLDEGRLLYVSPAFREIWGREPEELLEDPTLWIRTVLPEDRDRVRGGLDRAIDREHEVEYRIVRPDGDVRWIRDRAFPVSDAGGRVTRLVGVAEDITDRKETEERLGVLSREIREVIYILDPDGTVLFSTPSVENVTGYSREEFEGMDAWELVHEEDRPKLREVQDEMLAMPGATAHAQYRFVRKDGEVRHGDAMARNLIGQAGVDGILVTTRDVTDRVELEQTLRQSQRLEAIGRLAGGIAHDFNNLLTIIRSQTDLLLLDLEDSSPLVEDIEVIQSASDRAATLTNQLLAFSRDQVLQPRVVRLADVVEKMAELLDRVIGEDVEVRMSFPEEGRAAVKVDPGQLEHAVLNLAVNARDAMPDGGTLRFTTFQERVGGEAARERDVEPGVYAGLEVRDTGVGIDEETLPRIFEPFFTTRGSSGGTGLGLAMVYGFMKQSGGAIEVASGQAEGTAFTLLFPVADDEPDDATPRQETPDLGGRTSATVLVVEDDDGVRRVTRKILERSGLDVLEAANAEAGLTVLADDRGVDAVLTDLVLPGMSGRDLVDRVGERYPGLPVIVMSGYAADSPGQRGDLPAEIPFLPKPFTPEALVQTVREAAGLK